MRGIQRCIAVWIFLCPAWWLVLPGCSGEPECRFDTDCPGAFVCRNTHCADACEGVECRPGAVCEDGHCILQDPCGSIICDTPPGDAQCFQLPGTCSGGNCSYEPLSGQSCDDADPCTQNDRCRAEAVCLGESLPCTQPPDARCGDAAILEVFASPGICLKGVCEYGRVEVTCPGGCQNDACVGNACENVTCDSPPAPDCLNPYTRRVFSAEGMCSQGVCTYSYNDTYCPHGCDQGLCQGDPCLDVECKTPPENKCTNDEELQQFDPTGTCVDGQCQYQSRTVPCELGCLDGACKDCTPGWTDITACQCSPSPCGSCQGTQVQDDGCGDTRDVPCELPALGCPEYFECQPDGSCRLVSNCGPPALPGVDSIGFNYAPEGYLCKWAGSDYARALPLFKRDLVTLASLGTRVVRIMLLPYCLGHIRSENGGPGNWDMAEIEALRINLPRVIEAFRTYDIAVIPAIGLRGYYANGPHDGTTWWQWVYGSDGWSDFVGDMVTWSSWLVEAIEISDACSNVLYYDLHNEVDWGQGVDTNGLVVALMQSVPVQNGKRGISILFESQADQLVADLATSNTPLDFLEFHVYPDKGLHTDVPAVVASLQPRFSQSTILVGEFGGIFCLNGQDEALQRDTVLGVLDGAQVADVPALHWMLWDRFAGVDCDENTERVGLGFSHDNPRHAFGALAERVGEVPDADFENGVGGWYAGGVTTSVSVAALGPNELDSACGQHYGRLKIEAPGLHWLCSARFPVQGSHLAIHGYVRHSFTTNLAVGAHFYDSESTELDAPQISVTPQGVWAFHHLQEVLAGRVLAIPAGTSEVRLCFSLEAQADCDPTSPAYLDLDAVCAHGFSTR